MRQLVWSITLALALAVPGPARASERASELEPHPPILVVGDEGPTGLVLADHPVTGEPIYRPGSGVVSGRGTAADPYVIAGWDVAAIHLEGTTSHVEVRGNHVGALPATGAAVAAVHVADAANVRVVDNDIASADSGILFADSTNVRADANRVQGGSGGIDLLRVEVVEVTANIVTDAIYAVRVDDADGADVSGNRLVDTRTGSQAGVQVGNSTDVVVEHNIVVGHHTGVYVVFTEGLVVRDNTIGSFSRGINPWFTNGAVVERNTIDGPQNLGIGFAESSDSLVRDNRIAGPIIGVQFLGPSSGSEVAENDVEETTYGVAIAGGGPHTIRGNVIRSNGTGIHLSNTTGSRAVDNRIVANEVGVSAMVAFTDVALRGNHIAGNDLGASNQAAETLIASGNWWGCPQGPGAEGCDGTEGNVLVDPWLAEPPFAV